MKEPPRLKTLEVGHEEFRAIVVGRQRYVLLAGDLAFQVEPGDFLELIEKPDMDMQPREPERYVVCITQAGGRIPALDEDYQICSVSHVTEVALRLLEAAALRFQQEQHGN